MLWQLWEPGLSLIDATCSLTSLVVLPVQGNFLQHTASFLPSSRTFDVGLVPLHLMVLGGVSSFFAMLASDLKAAKTVIIYSLFIIKTITTCICACFPSTVVQSFCISIQAKIDNAAECHTLSNVRSLSWRMWSGFKSVQFYSIFFFWGGVVKWPNKILTWLKTSLMRIELYQFLLYFILIAHLIIYRQTSYSLTELCSTQSAIVLGNWFMKCDRKTIIYLQ